MTDAPKSPDETPIQRALRLKKADPPAVPSPPATVRAAVEGLEALAGWCQQAAAPA